MNLDFVVVVVVRTRPRAIPLAMTTTRKSIQWVSFAFLHGYEAPFASPELRYISILSNSQLRYVYLQFYLLCIFGQIKGWLLLQFNFCVFRNLQKLEKKAVSVILSANF